MAVRTSPRQSRISTVGVLACVIAAAWAFCIWAERSGNAAALHHGAMPGMDRPLWLSAAIVLVAWLAMTAAMMLPSSLGFIRLYAATARNAPDFPLALTAFLGAYFAVWTAFALIAFAASLQLHRLPLLAAGALALAAIYQFTPLKDACLRACRHPALYLMRFYRRGALNGWRIGFGHALYCLGCCWALMLVMFAVGAAHLAWMGVLAAIMFVEKATPMGERIVAPVGLALAALAVVAFAAPGAVPGL